MSTNTKGINALLPYIDTPSFCTFDGGEESCMLFDWLALDEKKQAKFPPDLMGDCEPTDFATLYDHEAGRWLSTQILPSPWALLTRAQ